MSFKTEDAQYLVDHLEKSGALYDLAKALVEARAKIQELETLLVASALMSATDEALALQYTKSSPAAERAIARFGKRDGMAILLNATCFPLSDTDALKQLEELIRRADAGASVGQLIAEAEAEHERETSELDAAQVALNSPPENK